MSAPRSPVSAVAARGGGSAPARVLIIAAAWPPYRTPEADHALQEGASPRRGRVGGARSHHVRPRCRDTAIDPRAPDHHVALARFAAHLETARAGASPGRADLLPRIPLQLLHDGDLPPDDREGAIPWCAGDHPVLRAWRWRPGRRPPLPPPVPPVGLSSPRPVPVRDLARAQQPSARDEPSARTPARRDRPRTR